MNLYSLRIFGLKRPQDATNRFSMGDQYSFRILRTVSGQSSKDKSTSPPPTSLTVPSSWERGGGGVCRPLLEPSLRVVDLRRLH